MPASPPRSSASESATTRLRAAVRASRMARLLLFTVAYAALEEISLQITVPEGTAAAWLPAGLAFAALLLSPTRDWPLLLAAVVAVNVPLNAANGPPTTVLPWFAVANVIEPLLATGVLRKLAPNAERMRSPRSVMAIWATGAAAPLVSAVPASIGMSLSIGSFADFFLQARTWWAGDALGIAILTPVLLGARNWRDRPTRWWIETIVMLAAITAVVWSLSHVPHDSLLGSDSLPLITAALLWPSLRLGQEGTAAAIMCVAVTLLIALDQGEPLFSSSELALNTQVAGLQVFIATLGLVHLTIATVVRTLKRMATIAEARAIDLQAYTEELHRSNEELSQFTYVASHDLSAPLRAVRGYTQLLAEDTSKFDPPAARLLIEVDRHTGYVQQMLDDLVDYSQASVEPLGSEPVALQQLVERVLDRRRAEIEHAGGTVSVHALPVVEGHVPRLERLFDNLIGNALKFHLPGEPPIVTISAHTPDAVATARAKPTAPARVVVTVTDQGIGIDPAHVGMVTRLFHRLHERSEFPGSGIGLAVCSKIVEGYGGTLAIDGKLGGGTEVSVDLPLSDAIGHDTADAGAGGADVIGAGAIGTGVNGQHPDPIETT